MAIENIFKQLLVRCWCWFTNLEHCHSQKRRKKSPSCSRNWTVEYDKTTILGLNGAMELILLPASQHEWAWKLGGGFCPWNTIWTRRYSELRKWSEVPALYFWASSSYPQKNTSQGKYKSSILYTAYGDKESDPCMSHRRSVLIKRKYWLRKTEILIVCVVSWNNLHIFDEASSVGLTYLLGKRSFS